MARFAALVCAIACLAGLADANAFLSSEPLSRGGKNFVSRDAVAQAFSFELGTDRGVRIQKLETELMPLFVALPKNSYGNLDPSVTRYALHRYFAQKFGWYVVGLEPAGGTWNSSSPGSIVKNRVPAFIEGLFEERLQGQGLDLRGLAVFAATLLDLVNSESHDDLQTVYMYHNLDMSSSLSPATVEKALNDYIILQFHSLDAGSNQSLNLRVMEAELREEYVIWRDVALWVRDVVRSLQFEQTRRSPFAPPGSFDALAETARELGHRFGAFQNLECQYLKAQLMELEYRGTGRVRLSEFYSGASDIGWTFTESPEYLRALGALDESNPSHPSVIIPNFVTSPTNCVIPSTYYSVCCLNECEGLMSSLERAIAGPTATPMQIADIVSSLPSDTVEAPRRIEPVELRRLQEIAALHGGKVPLHGRLFAQWMHHMYPRECPYPHLANTTNPVSPDEWIKVAGTTEASDEEMAKHAVKNVAESPPAMSAEAKQEALPWIPIEELVVSPGAVKQPRRFGLGAWQVACILSLVAATALRTKRASGEHSRHLGCMARVDGVYV